MKKTLINNSEEFLNFITQMPYCKDKGLEYIEELLEITVPYANPTDPSKFVWPGELDDLPPEKYAEIEDTYPIAGWEHYRLATSDPVNWPVSYPCVVLSWFESTTDRVGDSAIELLDFVYPSDFAQGNLTGE